MLIKTPLLRDILRFGKNQVADQVGPSGLPWDGGSGAGVVDTHVLVTETGVALVTETGALISDGT